jgi:ABC-type Na+ efflux pump, permease component
MNKTWLVFQREFLNRVQKKSFLIATILVPLIFPAILAIMFMVFLKQEEGATAQVIEVYDESGKLNLEDDNRFKFIKVEGDFETIKKVFNETDHYAILRIPDLNLYDPQGIKIYTRENPSIRKMEEISDILEKSIQNLKLAESNIDREVLNSFKTSVSISNVNIDDTGAEKESNTGITYALGFVLGMFIYIFVLVYGMQIMLGVIDEKTSKVVEVIISSVRPFQLMMGKILGIAAVGLVQFAIWIILISTLSSVTLGIFGVSMPQQQAMEQIAKMQDEESREEIQQQNNKFVEILSSVNDLPIAFIVFNFVFYFLGGYLLYGALFAAVGSAVDSQQEAQQFTFPIMLPFLISYFGLFLFILTDPHSTASFWFSVIPFTSPIAMVGRLGFNPPMWQLILSQVLLIAGFIFTTWVAARIYRIGILMHGSKVNYKVLAKWFMMKA